MDQFVSAVIERLDTARDRMVALYGDFQIRRSRRSRSGSSPAAAHLPELTAAIRITQKAGRSVVQHHQSGTFPDELVDGALILSCPDAIGVGFGTGLGLLLVQHLEVKWLQVVPSQVRPWLIGHVDKVTCGVQDLLERGGCFLPRTVVIAGDDQQPDLSWIVGVCRGGNGCHATQTGDECSHDVDLRMDDSDQ